MKCPHCSYAVSYDIALCQNCGYDLDDARERFGSRCFTFRRLIHPREFFTKEERNGLTEALLRLEQQFPEVIFGAFFVSLGDEVELSEFAFWMLNHCNLEDGEIRSPENCAFLILDTHSRAVCFALGYTLERIIPAADLHSALRDGEMYFCESDFAGGTQRVLRKFGKLLGKRARSGSRVPRLWDADLFWNGGYKVNPEGV